MSNFKRKTPSKIELVQTPDASVERFVKWVFEMPRMQAIALVLPYFLLVTAFDFYWGDDVLLVILYLPVVAFMAIRVSLKVAIYFALFCSIIWLADDILIASRVGPTPGELLVATIHGTTFVVIAIVLSRLRIALHHEYLRARYDYLTGLPNMQMFYDEARHVVDDSSDERAFSMIFIDCDNFKFVNDTHGHEEGDRVLKVVAHELASRTRQEDCIARFGGDEFVALFPGVTLQRSHAIVKKLQASLLQRMSENGWPVTFSIGIAAFSEPPENIEQAVKAADDLMYDCKSRSKNGITVKQAG